MFRNLLIKFGSLSSDPIVNWIFYCMVYGFLLSLLLILCLTVFSGSLFLYEYIFHQAQESELALYIAFVLFPLAMELGYPWTQMLYAATGHYSILGTFGCVALNGLLAGLIYGCTSLLLKALIKRN